MGTPSFAIPPTGEPMRVYLDGHVTWCVSLGTQRGRAVVDLCGARATFSLATGRGRGAARGYVLEATEAP